MNIVKARRAPLTHTHSIPALLTSLGIDFRKVKEQSFWDANKAVLQSIYRDFLYEIREKYRELHPDHGGDGHEFGKFVTAVNRAKKAFAWHLQSLPVHDSQSVQVLPVRQGRQKTGAFYKHAKCFEAVRMLREGNSIGKTAKVIGLNRWTVTKLRKSLMGVVKGCACGLPASHNGWCKVRFANSPARQEMMIAHRESFHARKQNPEWERRRVEALKSSPLVGRKGIPHPRMQGRIPWNKGKRYKRHQNGNRDKISTTPRRRATPATSL